MTRWAHRHLPRCFASRNASATRSSAGPSYGLPGQPATPAAASHQSDWLYSALWTGFTPPLTHRIQTPTEAFPRNNLVDLCQRLVLGVQPGIPLRKIKKSHLTHEHPSRCQQIVNPILNRRCAKMAFLEVPLNQAARLSAKPRPPQDRLAAPTRATRRRNAHLGHHRTTERPFPLLALTPLPTWHIAMPSGGASTPSLTLEE